MLHLDLGSHHHTYEHDNDEKQAWIALGLTALMAIISVALIVAAVLSHQS